MFNSIIKPKQPKGAGWARDPDPPGWVTIGYEGQMWSYPQQGITVISAVEVAVDTGGYSKGPEYHVSISKAGGRCSRNEARFVLKAFRMQDAEEDNHVPGGFVRNYWLPVNENLTGQECPCKESEPVIRENKGDFEWRGIPK